MEKEFEAIQEHYARIVRDIKLVLDDSRLTDEQKIRLLGAIL